MPRTECSQCGALYDVAPELSTVEVTKTLRWTRLRGWLAIIIGLVGMIATYVVWPSHPPLPVAYETTGPGIIRYYGQGTTIQTGNTNQRADFLLFETIHGADKVMQPLCQSQLSIHAYMQVEIAFRWVAYRQWHSGRGPENGEECYDIHNVKVLGPDVP